MKDNIKTFSISSQDIPSVIIASLFCSGPSKLICKADSVSYWSVSSATENMVFWFSILNSGSLVSTNRLYKRKFNNIK